MWITHLLCVPSSRFKSIGKRIPGNSQAFALILPLCTIDIRIGCCCCFFFCLHFWFLFFVFCFCIFCCSFNLLYMGFCAPNCLCFCFVLFCFMCVPSAFAVIQVAKQYFLIICSLKIITCIVVAIVKINAHNKMPNQK